MDYDFIILGSGLTAYAALIELVPTSSKILIIDYGLNQTLTKDELHNIDLQKINVGDAKKFMGDDFATKAIESDSIKGLAYSNSYAFGGLSNVWGCSIERFDRDEFHGLPDFVKELQYGYEKLDQSIKTLLPIDLYENNDARIHYFNKLRLLQSESFEVRKSELAIDYSKCIRCGECLYGCRHDATFNSKMYIQHQIDSGRVGYLGGMQVLSVKDKQNSSLVNCVDRKGQNFILKAKKILVCTGAINTAKIMLKSFESINDVEIKDSQYFMLPLLGLKSSKEFDSIALSQFVLKQKNILMHKKLHYQFYAPSAYTSKIIDQKFSLLPFKLPGFIKNRIFVIQGYLPSGISSSISLSRSGFDIVARESSSYSRLYLNYALNNLRRVLFKSELIPLIPLLNITPTFSGYHFGASFPVSNKFSLPNGTDMLGRIRGVNNIHILDSSVLPNIPSGSFSYTVMANAIRIVKEIKR